MSRAVNSAVDAGVIVTIAAGNCGNFCISTPGSADKVITVGATDKNDNLAGFSSRGPTIDELDYHKYLGHSHFRFEVEEGRAIFRGDINRILARNELAYGLDHDGSIVRLAPLVLRDTLKYKDSLQGLNGGNGMRLSKQTLILATIVPLIFGVIILWQYIDAINILTPLDQSTAKVHDQVIAIGTFSFLALAVYWCVMMYLIYLLQENLLILDSNLGKAADIGAKHLTESKNLLNQVIAILKRYESSQ